MSETISIRTLKRLTAAEGYLELELPDLALEELEGIDQPGPYVAVVDWLRGEAFKEKREFEPAIDSLSRAITGIPAPHNRRAIAALSECFRLTGREELAEIAEMFAVDEHVPSIEFTLSEADPSSGRFQFDDDTYDFDSI